MLHILYQQAQGYYVQGRTADALGILTQLAMLRPKSRPILHARALCLAGLRRIEAALNACDQLTAVGGDAEAEELRARIAEHQIGVQLKENLIANDLVRMSRRYATRRLAARNAIVGFLLVCCLFMGFVIGLWYCTGNVSAVEISEPTNPESARTQSPASGAPGAPAMGEEQMSPVFAQESERADALVSFAVQPQLVLESERGKRVLPVLTNAVMTKEPGNAAGIRGLTISRADSSRFLIKFDVPVRKVDGLVRAEIVLHSAMDARPDAPPLRLEVYQVTEGWDESRLSWAEQPATAKKPAAVFDIAPGQTDAVRVDVTPVAKSWLDGASNHGVLFKARCI